MQRLPWASSFDAGADTKMKMQLHARGLGEPVS